MGERFRRVSGGGVASLWDDPGLSIDWDERSRWRYAPDTSQSNPPRDNWIDRCCRCRHRRSCPLKEKKDDPESSAVDDLGVIGSPLHVGRSKEVRY